MELLTIGIIGYGLIGASMGMALKKYTSHRVVAFDLNEQVRHYAKKKGLADLVYTPEDLALSQCDIVFVALYPSLAVSFILENQNRFKENAIVCDLCGVKEQVVAPLRRASLRFVGAHPMAGRENPGIEFADADLFLKASFILTPEEDSDLSAFRIIESLARKVGFETIVTTTPTHHDKMIAYTSQLPHIASVAYVLQQAYPNCNGYHAGSFRDFSRVAKINAPLWSELFLMNKTAITEQIDEYIGVLSQIKTAIETEDESLFAMLKESARRKEQKDANH